MAKFIRSQEYENKLFGQALFDEKRVIKNARVRINRVGGKLKAYCINTDTFLQFPRALREPEAEFIADVVEVKNESVDNKYYRVMKGSIRDINNVEEVVG